MIFLKQNPIKKIRREKNQTQDELAHRLSATIGREVRQKDVSDWERSEHKPRREIIFALAEIFELDVIQFTKEVDEHFKVWNQLWNSNKDKPLPNQISF